MKGRSPAFWALISGVLGGLFSLAFGIGIGQPIAEALVNAALSAAVWFGAVWLIGTVVYRVWGWVRKIIWHNG